MSKKIMIAWGFVIFSMCLLLLFWGLKEKDFKYIKIEHSIKNASKKYIKKNNIDLKNNSNVIIFVDELLSGNYIDSKINDDADKYCINSVVYSRKLLTYEYKINIECNK